MNFNYCTTPAAKLTHNGISYNIDLQTVTSMCNVIMRKQMLQEPLEFIDEFSKPVFEVFIELFNPKSIIKLDSRYAVELLKIIRAYEAPAIEQELERRILEEKDMECIVSFINAAPDAFPGLYSYVMLHLDEFKTCKSLFDVPLASLCRGFPQQEIPQRPQQTKERHYIEIFETIKELKERDAQLDEEKKELDKQIADAKNKTLELDAENQKILKLCNETEREMNELKQKVQEKKKMISSLNEQLNNEVKAHNTAKKEAEKAYNDLQNANNKLKLAKQKYENLLHQ